MNPKISYIISSYNSSKYLGGLLEDLLCGQTEKEIEVIVVNSASEENDKEIAEKWIEKDKRVKLVDQEKRTPYGVSWLDGWEVAKGEIVANSNTDDRCKPWRGSAVYEAAGGNNTHYELPCEFLYGGYETWTNGKQITQGVPPEYDKNDWTQLFRGGVHLHWTNNIRKIVCWDVMYAAAQKYKSAFDYWLMLYFINLGVIGVRVPQIISIYNQRENSLEQSNKLANMFESLAAIETFFPGSPAIINLKKDEPLYQKYLDFCKERKLKHV